MSVHQFRSRLNSAFVVQMEQTCADCMSSALLFRRTRVLVSTGDESSGAFKIIVNVLSTL